MLALEALRFHFFSYSIVSRPVCSNFPVATFKACWVSKRSVFIFFSYTKLSRPVCSTVLRCMIPLSCQNLAGSVTHAPIPLKAFRFFSMCELSESVGNVRDLLALEALHFFLLLSCSKLLRPAYWLLVFRRGSWSAPGIEAHPFVLLRYKLER